MKSIGEKINGMTILDTAQSRKGRGVYLLDWRESPLAQDRGEWSGVLVSDLPASFIPFWEGYLFQSEIKTVDTYMIDRRGLVDPAYKLRHSGSENFFRRILAMSLCQLRRYLERGDGRWKARRRLAECLLKERGVDENGQSLLLGGVA